MSDIFLSIELALEHMAALATATPGDRLIAAGADGGSRAAFDRAEIVFGNPPGDWVAASPALRWVQLESVGFGEYAGLDWIALGSRVRMTNLAGFFAEPVAESILAGLLGLFRGIDRLAVLRDKGEWLGDGIRPSLRTLAGANVVLFGHGSINARVGDLLAPFGCTIVPFRSDWSDEALNAALASADAVISTVPDTPRTRLTFDRARLARMKPGALFLNFGRGSVVDDDALADALTSGALGGAVIDVTRDEPLPAGHRFWAVPNLILTQHSGGGTGDEIARKIKTFTDNLARYRRGEALVGEIDFSRGY